MAIYIMKISKISSGCMAGIARILRPPLHVSGFRPLHSNLNIIRMIWAGNSVVAGRSDAGTVAGGRQALRAAGAVRAAASFGAPSRDVPGRERQLLVRHILLRPDAPPGLAAKLRQRLAAGESFAELARQHSACPSRAKGGQLGWLRRGQTVQARRGRGGPAPDTRGHAGLLAWGAGGVLAGRLRGAAGLHAADLRSTPPPAGV